MEFLTEDFVKENELNETQVGAFKKANENYIADLKKQWDGKANENAEGILSGAAKYAAEAIGVNEQRAQGEKFGDYLKRITDTSLSTAQKALQDKQAELDTKLKNFKGGDEYKSQLETLTQEKDDLLKKVAELEPLVGFDEKYKEATEQLSGLKKKVAYNGVKPNFPETVNQYEAKAKWDEFVKGVEEKYNIELVDGEPIAVDKENQHKQVKLSELVSQNENINELLKGRQQDGTSAKPATKLKIEGVPFAVPEGATSEERSKLIREHLAKEGIGAMDATYSSKFAELNRKILSKGKAT